MVTEEAERRIMKTIKGSYKAILELYNVQLSDEQIDANISRYKDAVRDFKNTVAAYKLDQL